MEQFPQTQLKPIFRVTRIPKLAPTRTTQSAGVDVAFDYIRKGLRLAPRDIVRARSAYTTSLLEKKKLVLILDLDHTLLHSKRAEAMSREEEERLTASSQTDHVDAGLVRLGSIATWTKLRPFVREFLREADGMFDMYVYTMGSRAYAAEMAKLLDPEGRYFACKVIAREDSRAPDRKGLDVVLAEERLVVILDDTERVWGGNRGNLIVMPKYRFFGVQESTAGGGGGGTLATTLSLLKLVHQLFYDPAFSGVSPKDTRELLKEMDRRKAPAAAAAASTRPTYCASTVSVGEAVHAWT